jgi:hypothetical protein
MSGMMREVDDCCRVVHLLVCSITSRSSVSGGHGVPAAKGRRGAGVYGRVGQRVQWTAAVERRVL